MTNPALEDRLTDGTPYSFPFGQPVKRVVQKDTAPKKVFVLGVYSSAVHARWVGPGRKRKISAVAVASEPYIFWRGEGAKDIIAGIELPAGVGKLEPASPRLNGASGRSLDEQFLQPLGLTRDDAWLADLVPHSCRNQMQDAAIRREYVPLMPKYGLPEVSLPPVPEPLCGARRRKEILKELEASKATKIVLLGDQPIQSFLHAHDGRWTKLRDFGNTPDTYGATHEVEIAGQTYEVLALVHPRQASKLGAHSTGWHELHAGWIARALNR